MRYTPHPTLVMNRLALVTALALVVSVGCSVSLKERAVQQVRTLDSILSSAQDTEISLYESGTVAALTDDKHKSFHASLYKAMDANERMAIALRSWRAGDPVPNDTTSILDAANEALAVLEGVLPEASGVLGYVRRWLETAITLNSILSGGTS